MMCPHTTLVLPLSPGLSNSHQVRMDTAREGLPYLQLLHGEFFAVLLGTVYYEIQSIAVIFGVASLQFFLYSLLHKLM